MIHSRSVFAALEEDISLANAEDPSPKRTQMEPECREAVRSATAVMFFLLIDISLIVAHMGLIVLS